MNETQPLPTDALPDERAAFEARFPVPGGVSWSGSGYVVKNDYINPYSCDRFIGQWVAWQTRAAIAGTARREDMIDMDAKRFLEDPDVQGESGLNTYYSRDLVLEMLDAAIDEALAAEQDAERKPMTSKQMEAGREAIFSTGNPYCPCDSKTFRKVAEWVERHHGIAAQGDKP